MFHYQLVQCLSHSDLSRNAVNECIHIWLLMAVSSLLKFVPLYSPDRRARSLFFLISQLYQMKLLIWKCFWKLTSTIQIYNEWYCFSCCILHNALYWSIDFHWWNLGVLLFWSSYRDPISRLQGQAGASLSPPESSSWGWVLWLTTDPEGRSGYSVYFLTAC